MIAFSCAHCGMKLKVKPEFAGRSANCPTCKQPLTVPSPERTQAYVPKDHIDGTPSSVHQADRQKKQRFVEEAQITGQLEHPNIVPIHELGVDAQGQLFFTMKLVQGRSLAQVLDDLRNVPRVSEKDWPLSRLLNIYVNVCH